MLQKLGQTPNSFPVRDLKSVNDASVGLKIPIV